MKDTVIKIVSQILNVPVKRIDEDSSPDTVESWDSLKHMNLILALEEKLSIAFSDDEVVEMQSVRRILETVEKRMPKR